MAYDAYTYQQPRQQPQQYSSPPQYGQGQQPNAYNYQPFNSPTGWFPNEDEFRLGLYQQQHNFQNAGYFDPRGNQQLIEAGRMNAGNISGALQRQRNLASKTMGYNPTSRASYNLQSMLQGSGDQANLLNQALMEAWRRQADYAQQLSLGAYGLAPEHYQQEQPGFWDYAAGIAGQAAGGYLSSMGGRQPQPKA